MKVVTYLINEQHTGHQFCDTLVDVAVDNLVNLLAQLVRDLSLLGLHQLAHHAHNILATLRPRVGHIQIVEGHILDNFLLLVDVALGDGYVLLGLEVEFGRIGVGSADSLARSGVCFDVDNVSNRDALLLDGLVDAGVQAKLLGALGGLQSDNKMANCASVSTEGVLSLLGSKFCDFSLVHFLCFANTKSWQRLVADFLHLFVSHYIPIALRKFSINASVFLTSAE